MRVRAVSIVLTVLLMMGGLLPATPAVAAVHDVIGTKYEEPVLYLRDLGVVEGRPAGFFPLEPITRAEATKIMVLIVGKGDLADLLKGATSFKDVPSTHWATGYIAVAKHLGILHGFPDGTFKPDTNVTYAEYAKMLVEAAGLGPNPSYDWPLNYLDPASLAGILVETFVANAPAIRGDCAIMTATTVRTVPNPATGKTLGQSVFGEVHLATIELQPATTGAAVGAPVIFSAIVRDTDGNVVSDAVVAYSTSDPTGSVISAEGRFVAMLPGSYAVTARAGSLMATATVSVWGAPVALRAAVSPGTVIANGVSTATVTVEVVDNRGTRVPTATHAITVSHLVANGAVTLPVETTVAAVQGFATFTVRSTLLSSVTDTLRFSATGLDAATVAVHSADPRATSVRVTSSTSLLPANTSTPATVTAQVLDQAGQPMTFGTYYITFSIAGKGTLQGGTESIVVGTANQKAVVTVASLAGDPGSIYVTATSPALGSGAVSISTYIAGPPTSLAITSSDLSGEAGGASGMHVIVTLMDQSGRPAILSSAPPAPITVEFVPPDGSGLVGLSPVVFGIGDSSRRVDFASTKSGAFTVVVRDANTATPAVVSTSFTCTVTSGVVASVGLVPSGDPVVYIPMANPRLSFTAQLLDVHGNPVSKPGVHMQFGALVSGTGTVSWSAADGKVTTDGQGRATVTMYGQPYAGTNYTVTAGADLTNNGVYTDAIGSTASNSIRVTDRLPAGVTVTYTDLDSDQPISYVQADVSKVAVATVSLVDSYGNRIHAANFDIEITLSNQGRNVLLTSLNLLSGMPGPVQPDPHVLRYRTDGDGQVVISFRGGREGSFGLTVRCLNVVPATQQVFAFRTTGGTAVANALILRTDFALANGVAHTGTPVHLLVALVDNGGNPIAAPGNMTLTLNPLSGGSYRLEPAGADVTSVPFVKGVAYRSIYYVKSGTGTVDLANDVGAYIAYQIDLAWDAGAGQVRATVTAADATPVPGVAVRLYRLAGDGQFAGGFEATGVTGPDGVFAADYSGSGSAETVGGELMDGWNKSGGVLITVEGSVSF